MNKLAVCVCLTRDRPDLLEKAYNCFRRQTYAPRAMLIFDSSQLTAGGGNFGADPSIAFAGGRHFGLCHIGFLRNLANIAAVRAFEPEYILHWDDDDASAAERIEEQVALLEDSNPMLRGSNVEVVGYHSMPFLDVRKPMGRVWTYEGEPGYAIGASLCYRAETWRKRRFLDVPMGEDSKFLDGTDAAGKQFQEPLRVRSGSACGEHPRMISLIHRQSLSVAAGLRNFREGDGGPWVHKGDLAATIAAYEDMTEPAVSL